MRILVDANSTTSGLDHAVALAIEGDAATVGDLAKALGIPGEALVIAGEWWPSDALLSEVHLVEGARVGGSSESPQPNGIGQVWVGVSGGPSTGAVHRLYADGPSRVTIGRGPENDLDVENSSVSAQHAVIERDSNGVTITDLGSTNGTLIGSTPLSETSELASGETARIGSSTVEYVDVDSSDRPLATSAEHSEENGRILFNRSPRGPVAAIPEAIVVPEALPERKNPTLRIASLIVPIIFAGVMVVVLGELRFALFALLSPVLALGTWISGRRTVKQERAGDLLSRADAIKRLFSDLERAEQLERFRRREFAPDLLEVRRRVELPSSRLWERRLDAGDALTVGLGVGTIPWDPAALDNSGAVEYDGDVLEILGRYTSLESVEVFADLREGPLGLVGDESRAHEAARSALLQLATHHGPSDISIAVLTTDERLDDWRWAQWMPHLATAAGGVQIFVGDQSNDFASSLINQFDDGSLFTKSIELRPAMLFLSLIHI